MYKIEYEIKLNENGRPYIYLADDYENKHEDRFFALELSRYVLQDVYNRRSPEFNPETADKIELTVNLLGQVSDEVAHLLWNGMKSAGDVVIMLNNKYHIQVRDIENRDKLGKYIYYEDKIFARQEGLKVLVTSEMKIYELKDGITNENWIEVRHES